jgi:hypothetical protein
MTVGPADAYRILADLLHSRSGLAIGPDRLRLLEGRLAPILWREKPPDLTALVRRLSAPGSREADP